MQYVQFFPGWCKKNKILLFLVVSVFFYCISVADAAYTFDKTRLTLSLKRPIDTIQFNNPGGNQPVILQTKVVRWIQDNGNDVYQPTKDLIIAPPQSTIPKNKKQLVRVGWRNPMPLNEELAYRMIVNDLTLYEVPKNAVRLKLQVNLPIFIMPDNPVYQLQWKIKRISSNQLNIQVTNTGNMHVEVTKLVLTNAAHEVVARQSTQFYILPHQSKQGGVPITKPLGQQVTITAETDNGNLSSTVNIL